MNLKRGSAEKGVKRGKRKKRGSADEFKKTERGSAEKGGQPMNLRKPVDSTFFDSMFPLWQELFELNIQVRDII